MPTVDFESLISPVSADDPCGPDLDLAGDSGYMNFIASAEGLLPSSYFVKDQSGSERPFDRTVVDLKAVFEAAKPFLARTRDLRLLAILAKFSILDRDLAGFTTCIRAISALLSTHWDEVHPRSEDGDFGMRMVAVESIDTLPTVVMPLQFLPLIEHERLGSVSYRGHMIAKGELQPREGEEVVALPAVEKVLNEIELAALVEKRDQFMELGSALTQIARVWHEKNDSGPAVSLERLPQSVAQIFTMLETTIAKRDPGASLAAAGDGSEAGKGSAGLDASQPGDAVASGRVNSSAQAARALAAAAKYFSQREPSNPALLLVRQASEVLGKSFFDVMRILVPTVVEKAAFSIGKDQQFDLPIQRLSTIAVGTEVPVAGEIGPELAGELPFEAQSRADALLLLEQVGTYFRTAEPSSPIPLLTERARDLAQRDFFSVLKALLPADTFKPSNRGG